MRQSFRGRKFTSYKCMLPAESLGTFLVALSSKRGFSLRLCDSGEEPDAASTSAHFHGHKVRKKREKQKCGRKRAFPFLQMSTR